MKIIDTAQALPPSGHFVLAWLEGSKIPMRALWADKFSLGVSAEQSPEWGEYSEEKDEYFCPAGWYEMNQHEESHWRVDGNVVAWCELPRLDHQCLAQIEEPAGAAPAAVAPQGVVAWMTPEGDRVVTAETMDGARKDGGASLSSLRPYSVALVRGAAASAPEAPAAPAIGPKLARIMGYREHYRTWGRQLSDATELVESHPSHWRIVAEAMDELADALAAAPQAPAAPAEAMPYLQARLMDYKCQRVDNAGGTPGLTLYMTKLGAHPEYQLYLDEAMALWINLGRALGKHAAAPAAPAVDASDDKALLDALAAESMDLRCFDMPTGQGDADVGWRVIQHHMGEPAERVVSEVYKDDPRSAIRAAIARLARDPYCTGPLHEEDAALAAEAKEGGA